MRKHDAIDPSRRTILQGLGAGVLAWGCGSSDDDGTAGDGSTSSPATGESGGGGASGSGEETSLGTSAGSSGGGTSADESGTTAAADDTDSTGAPSDCDPADAWASGGTAAMTAQACYPDPFAAGVPACMLLCQTTDGPCTTVDTPDRQDVSEGYAGLPVRLALKIVEADGCTPVPDAFVEIWHTQPAGVYSGVTPGGSFCNGGDPSAEAEMYFRGSRTTDGQGRVDFDTCYPGWYGGRAIHIHFRIVVGGSDFLVSQLFFDDALNDEIFSSHPDYAPFGTPDTLNTTDGVIGGVGDLSPYLLETARMADGAMLASKVIAIRSSTGDPLCTA